MSSEDGRPSVVEHPIRLAKSHDRGGPRRRHHATP